MTKHKDTEPASNGLGDAATLIDRAYGDHCPECGKRAREQEAARKALAEPLTFDLAMRRMRHHKAVFPNGTWQDLVDELDVEDFALEVRP